MIVFVFSVVTCANLSAGVTHQGLRRWVFPKTEKKVLQWCPGAAAGRTQQQEQCQEAGHPVWGAEETREVCVTFLGLPLLHSAHLQDIFTGYEERQTHHSIVWLLCLPDLLVIQQICKKNFYFIVAELRYYENDIIHLYIMLIAVFINIVQWIMW